MQRASTPTQYSRTRVQYSTAYRIAIRISAAARWQPLRVTQHGDLNASNVLLDKLGTAWLVDFPARAVDHTYTDAARLITAILVEESPLPLTLAEARALEARALRVALGMPSAQVAARLHAALQAATTHSDLRSILAIGVPTGPPSLPRGRSSSSATPSAVSPAAAGVDAEL